MYEAFMFPSPIPYILDLSGYQQTQSLSCLFIVFLAAVDEDIIIISFNNA
jgi:hypothetical protein